MGQAEGLRIELLHLATILLRFASDLMLPHKRELIKFGWNHLKKEDSIRKSYAFLNVAYYLRAYVAPDKIVLQVGGESFVCVCGGGGGACVPVSVVCVWWGGGEEIGRAHV